MDSKFVELMAADVVTINVFNNARGRRHGDNRAAARFLLFYRGTFFILLQKTPQH